MRCDECGRTTIKAGEPVWRVHTRRPWPGRGYSGPVGIVCRSCRRRFAPRAWNPQPCEICARPVHWQRDYGPGRARIFTCGDETCQAQANLLRVKRLRAFERGTRTCSVCEATFTPQRSDARYCSNSCRQIAYRQRLALA